jgi:hypothetical protein
MLPDVPRLVRVIVCGYSLGELPTPWLMTFHRFEAALDRAGWHVRVKLAPLEDLPEEPFEVLVVTPELAAQARTVAPSAELLTATPTEALPVINRLLAALADGAELYAEPLDPGAPKVERYRGFLPL